MFFVGKAVLLSVYTVSSVKGHFSDENSKHSLLIAATSFKSIL